MQSITGLIARLGKAQAPDRKLDSEILAAVLGPPGCVLDPIEMLDGWDIQLAPDASGEAALWREAADVPAVTAFFDAACEVVQAARLQDAASVMARALRTLGEPEKGMTATCYAGSAGRRILLELLRTMQVEEGRLADAAYATSAKSPRNPACSKERRCCGAPAT